MQKFAQVIKYLSMGAQLCDYIWASVGAHLCDYI